MKIGTISLNINTHDLNYGAMLHSWAFQTYLHKKEKVESEIIDYVTSKYAQVNLKYPLIDYIKKRRYKAACLSMTCLISHSRRFEKFERFKKNQLVISDEKYSKEIFEKYPVLNYDVIVCESDVIWSPQFFDGSFDPVFFLALPCMHSSKRIAYAVSMADGIFNEKQERDFANLIGNLDAVSCRESYAAEYAQRFYNKKVSCVFDPVLLLQSSDYDEITAPRMIEEPYVLVYTLSVNAKFVHKARLYAKEKKIKLVEISSYPWHKLKYTTITDAGVEEFLSLVKYAEVIFCNSFHGVCFSLIFQKEFFAFNDRKFGKKIEDICNRLEVSERFEQSEFNGKQKLDYGIIDKRIKKIQRESISWIKNNILNACCT